MNTEEGKVLLFTTKTCPNCKLAKDSLEKANISYEVVDAGENEELVRKYGVMQAPTLIVIKEEGVQKLANASNIRAFAEKRWKNRKRRNSICMILELSEGGQQV